MMYFRCKAKCVEKLLFAIPYPSDAKRNVPSVMSLYGYGRLIAWNVYAGKSSSGKSTPK